MADLTEFEKLIKEYEGTTPSVQLPSSVAGMSEKDLADLYASQRNSGFSDAQIKEAATQTYGQMNDTDWNYLTNLAGFGPASSSAGVVADKSVVDTSSPLNTYTKQYGGQDYSLGTDVVNKLTQQILAQNTTSKWTGEGFGSASANAKAMAENLAASGITDINQVGKASVTIPGYDQYTGGDAQNLERVDEQTVEQLINKATGKQLINDFAERGGTGDVFSGTYSGKGNTAYRVAFDAKGNPYFYTTGGSSNDLVNLLAGDPILSAIAQAGAAYVGGPLGTAALAAAMGKDPKDIAKAATLSYLGNEAFKGLTDTGASSNIFGETGAEFAKDIKDIFGKTGSEIIGKTTGQYVAGGGNVDIEALLLNQGVGAATNAVLGEIPGYNSLNPTERTFVNKIVTATLNDGKLSPGEAINAAISAGTQAVKTTSTGTKVSDAGDDEFQLPGGTQVAGPYSIDVSGVSLFKESVPEGFTPPAGLRLLSVADDVKEVYDSDGKFLRETKPMGSYIDYSLLPGKGVWVVKDDFVQKFDTGNFANDIAMFYQNQGDLDKIAQGTPSTFDDELADLLKYKGIKNNADLNASNLNIDNLIDLFNANMSSLTDTTGGKQGIDAGTLNVTGNRDKTTNTTDTTKGGNDNIDTLFVDDKKGTSTVVDDTTKTTKDDDIDELVITDKKDDKVVDLDTLVCGEGYKISDDGKSCVLIPKTDTKVDTKVDVPAKKTKTTPTPTASSGNAPPSQDPYAHIKFMEELFGGEVSPQFLTDVLGGEKGTNVDLDALLSLLRK
jgi:hypothetical protein